MKYPLEAEEAEETNVAVVDEVDEVVVTADEAIGGHLERGPTAA